MMRKKSAGQESRLYDWFSVNPQVDVHAYPDSGRYCVCNNSYEPQKTVVYTQNGENSPLAAGELRWIGRLMHFGRVMNSN